MRKIIYSFLLLLSLTRSSECTFVEYDYKYWDGSEEKPGEELRKITVPLDYSVNLKNLKDQIITNLKISSKNVTDTDIDIYMVPSDNEKEPEKVKEIKTLMRGSTQNKLIVFRKTRNVEVMPALTTLVTLCNCKERSIKDTRIPGDKTIGDVKKKFGLSDDMKLLQESNHLGGKTVPQKRSDNTNLSDDTQLKDIMEESDKKVKLFVYPEDKVPVKEKFNLSDDKKLLQGSNHLGGKTVPQKRSDNIKPEESDTDTARFAHSEDIIPVKDKITIRKETESKPVPQKLKANYWAYLFFGLTVLLVLYVVHLKQLLNASKSNTKKKRNH